MPDGTQTFPLEVDAYIVRRGNQLAVVDSNQPDARPMDSILVHYDGEIEWHCDLGPWEVLRKMDGPNPFKGVDGAKGNKSGTQKTPACGPSRKIVQCGYSVAVWDEAEKELLLMDPDIVVGPPVMD